MEGRPVRCWEYVKEVVKMRKLFCGFIVTVAVFGLAISTGNRSFASEESLFINREMGVVVVGGSPVGFVTQFSEGKCTIVTSLFPVTPSRMAPGDKGVIKVLGEGNIIIECIGEKGIKITRE